MKKIISIISVLTFASVSFAQESKIEVINKGTPAPYTGVLIDSKTGAKILAEKEFAKERCQVEVEHEKQKAESKCELEKTRQVSDKEFELAKTKRMKGSRKWSKKQVKTTLLFGLLVVPFPGFSCLWVFFMLLSKLRGKKNERQRD